MELLIKKVCTFGPTTLRINNMDPTVEGRDKPLLAKGRERGSSNNPFGPISLLTDRFELGPFVCQNDNPAPHL